MLPAVIALAIVPAFVILGLGVVARAIAAQRVRGLVVQYAPERGATVLRDALSDGTLRQLEQLDARPAASAEDRWQRRAELVFERLAVSWEIAGLPLDSQKELLGRYRMASADERRWVRETLAEHLAARHPDVTV